MAKEAVAKASAPRTMPIQSIRPLPRSEVSGTKSSAMRKATAPKSRLNQKMACQLHSPTSTPPMTGPRARARPETAAHTPSASARVRRSG